MRALSGSATAAIAGSVVSAAVLVELGFDPVIRLCTASVDIDAHFHTWSGVGNLGSIDAVNDVPGASEAVRFALSGVPSENMALALGDSVRDIQCRVYFAIFHADTHEVLDAPLIWAGLLDQLTISEQPPDSSVSASAKHIGSLFARVKPLRYTAGDQQRIALGDTSLRFVTSQAQHKDVWPAASWGRA